MIALLILAALTLPAAFAATTATPFVYPEARREAAVDDYFGTRIADPYRWMEEAGAPAVKDWLAAQNEITRRFIDGFPGRAAAAQRLTRIWDFARYGAVERQGSRYFFSKNDGLQNQSVLYMQEALDAPPRVVLDPNALSADGTVDVSQAFYSRDGRTLAYALSSKGSDWQELHIKRLDAGASPPEVLKRLKFSQVAWAPDGSGFYYNRFPDEGSVPAEDENRHNRVYWHALGAPQSEDRLVYERPDRKDWILSPWLTDDGRYLLVTVSIGTDPRTRLFFREAASQGPFRKLFDDYDAKYLFIGSDGPLFYVLTDKDAPKGRIISVDVRDPESRRDVVPESDETVVDAAVAGRRLVAHSLKDAHSRLRLFDLAGQPLREVELPGLGTVSGLRADARYDEFFFGFTSYLFPPRIYRYDLKRDALSQVFASKVDFDVDRYETRQVFFPSKDGTRVPMFIVRRKGLKLDGSHPTLLYGYGGFNISLTPAFSIHRLLWLERGGVLAVANLRGGEEYGEEWHRAGMLDRKQNVFDDFIAAAEWLVANKYTSPARLAIQGGSNGGLLVAAAMLQRPELFGAVLCHVPVIDMLRYQRFTVGHMWVPEYGSAEASPEQFRTLLAYSPLHNVREGRVYPPLLITAADTDDRVVPSHARKFAAVLQHADSARVNPILLRFDVKAGHGHGKPTAKLIAEQADVYSFLFRVFGMGG